MQKSLKIKEFVIKEEKNPRSFCDSFVYEPSNYEEEKLGILFLIGEVLNFHPEAKYLLNYLASLIRREYYSGLKNEPSRALEAALKKANFVLAEIKRREGVNLNEKIKFLAAVIAQNRLSFSQMGKTYGLLLRTNQLFDLSKKIFQLTNYFPDNFLHTLQGQIYLNDKIVFATENLFKTLTLREFKQIFETETPEETSRNLELIFNGPQRLNVAAIMIESLTGNPPPKPKLIQRKKKTGTLTLEEIFGQKKQKAQIEEKITLFEEAPLSSQRPLLEKEIGTRNPSSSGRITLIAAKIAARLTSTTNKNRIKLPVFRISASPLKRLLSKIFCLPAFAIERKSVLKKIYLCVSLAFAVLLIVFIAENGVFKKEIIVDYSALAQAKQKIEESDNYLIARKKDSALKNLAEAQTLVRTILLAHFEGKKNSGGALDEAIKLATEIRQKIIKIETEKNKK